jgi:rhodanese-related sulfurtransferase
MKKILIFLAMNLIASDHTLVNIDKDTPYIFVDHKGVKVKIARIQDVDNRLSDDYTKTSRECPPFCIHPTSATDGVETIAELEFIKYMKQEDALIIDSRLKSWYELETIPSALNIPFNIFQNGGKKRANEIFKYLGMGSDNNLKDLKTLVIFDNGIWCDQSTRLIKSMVKFGYPKDKLKYYRSGFQGWKLLGLTTVVQKENKK